MRQILCVRLLNWEIEWLEAKELGCGLSGRKEDAGEEPHGGGVGVPWAIVATAGNQRTIEAASATACSRGVEVGMPLARAQAICSVLTHREHDPARDARALAALARWMMRFSPLVCPGFEDHSIFLDVTGCQRVFGGLDQILGQIMGTMRRWRLTARSAIAPTAGAAWALAQYGSGEEIVIDQGGDLRGILAPLPVAGLRLDGDCVRALHHLGIGTIGQLLGLPRSALPARFGERLLLRLDQATGRISEPLDFLAYEAPIRAREDFDAAISGVESIRVVLEKLIGRIVVDLMRVGCGVRRMEIDFLRPYAAAIHQTILFSRPTRDGKKIFRLVECSMEGMGKEQAGIVRPPPRRGGRSGRGDGRTCHLFPPAGFVGIAMEAAVVERIEDEQLGLLEQGERTGRIELEDLIERLTARLGPEGLVRPELVESHVPEKAVREMPGNRVFQQKCGRPSPQPSPGVPGEGERGSMCLPARPLQLLSLAVGIRVMATSLADGDGRPVSFVHGGLNRRIVQAVGPERITGQWWEGPARTRDYFDVEDAEGRRFWIFRVLENSRWFLHGEW